MAVASEWSCPICHDHEEDIAYMSPCLHQFCLGCALRWAWQKPNCPLCRLPTTAILLLVELENLEDYLMFQIPGATEPPAEDHQDEQGAAGPVAGAQVGGFSPEVWADFFKSHPDNLKTLLLWVRQELAQEQWWQVAVVEGTIVQCLCLYGLDAVLVWELQAHLQEHTPTFICWLITSAVHLYGSEICQHLEQQEQCAAGGQDEGPAASPSPTASRGGTPDPLLDSSSSSAGSDAEEQPWTSQVALRGDPGWPPPAPVPAQQEQPRQEPGEAAVAGPSAQGCSRSPSAPTQGRDHSPEGPRRSPKRRAPGHNHALQPCKRPPRRRH
ncbi:uncharacterized protein LOC142358962 isoform X2 [Opisthocomus hoazin]